MGHEKFDGQVPVHVERNKRRVAPRRQNQELGWNTSDYVEPIFIPEDDNEFNPLQILLYVVRYRWLIVILLTLGFFTGYLVTLTMAPKYKAEVLIEVLPPSVRVIQDLQILDERTDYRTFQTILTKLQSRQLKRRVVHELGLTEKPDFLFPKAGFSLRNLVKRALGRLPETDPEKLDATTREQIAVGRIASGLELKLLRNTRIISVKYSSTNPEYARRISNQFANSYIASGLDQTSETSRLARQFVGEQVANVKLKLETAEKKLVAYAKKEGITLNGDDGSLVASNIKAINEALSQAIQDRLRYERLVQQITAGKVMGLEEILGSSAIQASRQKLVELQAEYRQKRRKFKPGYPEMRELKAQINEFQRLMKQDIWAISNGVRLKHQIGILKEKDLVKKLKELELKQAVYQDKNINYTILKREVDAYRSQYKSLIEKLNQLGVASQIKNKRASIVQYASLPGAPFSPRISLNLLIAVIASGAFAVALIYILELLNNTFINPEQLESELKLPVLGVLPKLPTEKLEKELANELSNLRESYRTLRTSIQFTGTNGAPKTLLITSTEPSEGKSTIAQKLAEEFGALGNSVLLIDADMRKPVQHRNAGIANSLGLSNLLTNTVPTSQVDEELEIMRPTSWPNVWLVTAGTLPPNPANLLASQKMGLFIEACTNRYDIVIIDSPPVIGLADALLLSRLAESTVLVVAAQVASRKSVQNTVKKLQSAAGHVVGTVLNQFQMDRLEYKYSYKYMNYGYLYHEDAYSYGENKKETALIGRDQTNESRGEPTTNANKNSGVHGSGNPFTRIFRRFRTNRSKRDGERADKNEPQFGDTT